MNSICTFILTCFPTVFILIYEYLTKKVTKLESKTKNESISYKVDKNLAKKYKRLYVQTAGN